MSTPGIIIDGTQSSNFFHGTAGDDAFSGTNANEVFDTGMGNDQLYAGAGDDVVSADLGNDTLDGGSNGTDGDLLSFYYVNQDRKQVGELSPFGVTFDLNKHVQDLGYYGIKTTYNFENLEGTNHNDKFYGTSGNNEFSPYSGNDYVDGRAGDDAIFGGAGKDTMVGGKGADFMTGGVLNTTNDDGSRDTFRYNAISDSGLVAGKRDIIWGFFNGGGSNGDKIDLGALSSSPFKFIGDHAFHHTAAHEVQVTTLGTNDYLVSVDTDSDTAAEMTIEVHSAALLTAGDFIL